MISDLLEDRDREKRSLQGYGNEDEGAGVTYGDLPENIELEDSDRIRRNKDGYGDDFEEAAGGNISILDLPQKEGEEHFSLRAKLYPKMNSDSPLDMLGLGDDFGDEGGVDVDETCASEDEMPMLKKILLPLK